MTECIDLMNKCLNLVTVFGEIASSHQDTDENTCYIIQSCIIFWGI